jgi:hydroxymethylbilane synthase
MLKKLTIAARSSLLSQAQVKEVISLLQPYGELEYQMILTESKGDLDLVTPLNSLAKSDFFTSSIDALVINQKADIAIHSAKDLPDALDDSLEIIAITSGVDPRDSLVSFKYTLRTLPPGAVIGACSDRRIEEMKKLRNDLCFQSIRGTIESRIEQLKTGNYDAIVLAEAGLKRLQLDVPREILDIKVAPLQGRLAIVAHRSRSDLKNLFKVLDSRLCG